MNLHDFQKSTLDLADTFKGGLDDFLKCCFHVFLPPRNISGGNERRNLSVDFFSISQPKCDSTSSCFDTPFRSKYVWLVRDFSYLLFTKLPTLSKRVHYNLCDGLPLSQRPDKLLIYQ